MGASGERQASGNSRAPCEVGCERASIHTAAPGHPHGESCASSGRHVGPEPQACVRVATSCKQLGAADGSFNRATRLGPSSGALWMGHEKASVQVTGSGSPHGGLARGADKGIGSATRTLCEGNVEPAAPSHPRREPCSSACQAERSCTVVHPLQACVRVATSCEQREHRQWELGPRCSPHAAAALRVGQRARVGVQS